MVIRPMLFSRHSEWGEENATVALCVSVASYESIEWTVKDAGRTKVTVLPPGEAFGARDMQRWSLRRGSRASR